MENNNENRYDNGAHVMNELFSEEIQTGMRHIQEISPDLWDMIVSFGFGDLYARNTLSLAQREYITLTALITQGAFDQLRPHIHASLKIGMTQQEITEIIIQCAGYVGFPKAVHAMGIAGEIFKNYNEDKSNS
ncbi:carboxymuconolactone decarboxylase family protein [Sporosarcina sp. BI001-red]|uniref:carboxymuconolactone decarboxylase family protein n=1 Tax=Sporosarcina sp. BI001-red TaxID=2282866 RepID=UPI000E2899CE|nr:carboxymuconolactone decarboxylase family protein [Sporosarcina sp. BI001-red]REB08781.1 carboxymuconolactone decarboxylase family protein [Sporosarcina sp. BI001-red]